MAIIGISPSIHLLKTFIEVGDMTADGVAERSGRRPEL